MHDGHKTKKQLINELVALRKIINLENPETRHQQADGALRVDEVNYRKLLEIIPVGIIRTTIDGKILETNSTVCQMSGYIRSELENINVRDLYLNPKKHELLLNNLQRDRTIHSNKIQFKCKNGTIFNVILTMSILTISSKDTIFMAVQDIFDQKRRIVTLEEKESQYRAIFNSATDAFLIFDRNGNIVEGNPQACKMYGYPYEKLITLSYKDIIHPDYLQVFEQFKVDVWTKGEFAAESKDIKKDGTVMIVEVKGAKFEYKGEKHILGILRDVTRRKQAEKALSESGERFRQLAENIHEVFWLSDTDKSKMLYISPAYERVWGKTCASLYQDPKSYLGSIHTEDRMRVTLRQTEQTLGTYEDEYRIVRSDGSIRWIRDRAFPIRDEMGEVYRIAGIAEDITERKQVEEKFLNYQKQLQSLASELSLAEERERRRIATWLHDYIGQNLAISRIKLKTLQGNPSSTEFSQAVEVILSFIDQTIQSVRSLTFELSPPLLYELGLGAALEWLTEKFQVQHGITCEFEHDNSLQFFEDDMRVLIFQVVRELLINIAKHSKARKAKVSLQSKGDHVRIIVEDDGVGFDVSTVNQTWEKQTYGFGLFSIRERLVPFGADFKVETSKGQGTRVILFVPKRRKN
jgi:PAS domain S-box-containing protein